MKQQLKKLIGKEISKAIIWNDEDGSVCLELSFKDDMYFCLDVEHSHKLKVTKYFDNIVEWGDSKKFRPLKEYK